MQIAPAIVIAVFGFDATGSRWRDTDREDDRACGGSDEREPSTGRSTRGGLDRVSILLNGAGCAQDGDRLRFLLDFLPI